MSEDDRSDASGRLITVERRQNVLFESFPVQWECGRQNSLRLCLDLFRRCSLLLSGWHNRKRPLSTAFISHHESSWNINVCGGVRLVQMIRLRGSCQCHKKWWIRLVVTVCEVFSTIDWNRSKNKNIISAVRLLPGIAFPSVRTFCTWVHDVSTPDRNKKTPDKEPAIFFERNMRQKIEFRHHNFLHYQGRQRLTLQTIRR